MGMPRERTPTVGQGALLPEHTSHPGAGLGALGPLRARRLRPNHRSDCQKPPFTNKETEALKDSRTAKKQRGRI